MSTSLPVKWVCPHQSVHQTESGDGQTPNDFILNIRLKKGAVMLRNNPELNITEISDRIGFSSSRYFSKCFKEIYHVSPLAYRKGEEKEEGDGEETDNLYNGDNN